MGQLRRLDRRPAKRSQSAQRRYPRRSGADLGDGIDRSWFQVPAGSLSRGQLPGASPTASCDRCAAWFRTRHPPVRTRAGLGRAPRETGDRPPQNGRTASYRNDMMKIGPHSGAGPRAGDICLPERHGGRRVPIGSRYSGGYRPGGARRSPSLLRHSGPPHLGTYQKPNCQSAAQTIGYSRNSRFGQNNSPVRATKIPGYLP